MDHFVVVDCETTGLDPAANKITEIAAITADLSGNIRSTYSALLAWDIDIPDKITQLTGITSELLRQKGQSPRKVLSRLAEITAGKDVVAYNSDFDFGFLRAEAKRLNVSLTHKSEICALDTARKAWPLLIKHRLSATATWTGASKPTHRAISDCLATLHVFCCATRKIQAGEIIEELKVDEFTITAMDIEELRSCAPNTELILWTRDTYDHINAYKEDAPHGQGLVFRFRKDRNSALCQKMATSKQVLIIIDSVEGATISMNFRSIT